jgi:hypothetical protein
MAMVSTLAGHSGTRADSLLFIGVVGAIGLISIIGYWKVTTPGPDPIQHEHGLGARKLIRISPALEFSPQMIQRIPGDVYPTAAFVARFAASVAASFIVPAVCTYFMHLAHRLPTAQLAGTARTIMMGMFVFLLYGL